MLITKKRTKLIINAWIFDKLIPEDYELMKIAKAVNFDFVTEETKDLYCKREGRPSWPPVVLFKMLFLEYCANLSDVEVCKRCRYNLVYRKFLGLEGTEDIPDDSTLVVFMNRPG